MPDNGDQLELLEFTPAVEIDAEALGLQVAAAIFDEARRGEYRIARKLGELVELYDPTHRPTFSTPRPFDAAQHASAMCVFRDIAFAIIPTELIVKR